METRFKPQMGDFQTFTNYFIFTIWTDLYKNCRALSSAGVYQFYDKSEDEREILSSCDKKTVFFHLLKKQGPYLRKNFRERVQDTAFTMWTRLALYKAYQSKAVNQYCIELPGISRELVAIVSPHIF
ncbi:MAG: hypothetical protein ABW007_19545, partial [Chitinophagaceae bacterium]